MLRLYLAFKPVSSPFPQALFRAETIKLIHAACFPYNRFSRYDLFTNLTSHVKLSSEEMVLSSIKLFLKAEGQNRL